MARGREHFVHFIEFYFGVLKIYILRQKTRPAFNGNTLNSYTNTNQCKYRQYRDSTRSRGGPFYQLKGPFTIRLFWLWKCTLPHSQNADSSAETFAANPKTPYTHPALAVETRTRRCSDRYSAYCFGSCDDSSRPIVPTAACVCVHDVCLQCACVITYSARVRRRAF